MKISDVAANAGLKSLSSKVRPWDGPMASGERGGVTQSLLNRFLTCRERFRVYAVEGLRSAQDFDHRLFYGNCWHVCEEALAEARETSHWEVALKKYALEQSRQYANNPKVTEQIEHWYTVCRVQFPEYVRYWSAHKDVTNRTLLLQEQPFDVPYRLPSGRTVRLRGKWDSVDLVNAEPPCTCGADRTGPSAKAHSKRCPAGGSRKVAGPPLIWNQENKTKGDVYEPKLTRQLKFDIQSMFYQVALHAVLPDKSCPMPLATAAKSAPIAGVRYNVVRRPLSGGKYSIVRHKPTKKNPAGETKAAYYARLGGLIHDDPGHFFLRFNVPVTPEDVADFCRRFLDPVLEQLCDWWDWIQGGDPWRAGRWGDGAGEYVNYGAHWQHPFGCRNVLDEGGATDLDEFVLNGVRAGLKPVDTVFPELVQ